uniref:t-SNARE coiled-coil homology domain-containing protein n=1 Tax=Parastrongyloides trichosuri TaxID=131310 RepID=A0A0N4ZR80_PARTI
MGQIQTLVDLEKKIEIIELKVGRIESKIDLIQSKVSGIEIIANQLSRKIDELPSVAKAMRDQVKDLSNNCMIDSEEESTLKENKIIHKAKSTTSDNVLTDESDGEYTEAIEFDYPCNKIFQCSLYNVFEKSKYKRIGKVQCSFIKNDNTNIFQIDTQISKIPLTKYEILCGFEDCCYRFEEKSHYYLVKISEKACIKKVENLSFILLKFHDKEEANTVFSYLQKK